MPAAVAMAAGGVIAYAAWRYAVSKLIAVLIWHHQSRRAAGSHALLDCVMRCLKHDPYNSFYLNMAYLITETTNPAFANQIATRMHEHFDGDIAVNFCGNLTDTTPPQHE